MSSVEDLPMRIIPRGKPADDSSKSGRGQKITCDLVYLPKELSVGGSRKGVPSGNDTS